MENRKRVFVKHAQVLSDETRHALSEKEKAYEKTCEDRGVWLELFFPDDACFTEVERARTTLSTLQSPVPSSREMANA